MKKFVYLCVLLIISLVPLMFISCGNDYDYIVQFFVNDNLVATKYYYKNETIGELPSIDDDMYVLEYWEYSNGDMVKNGDVVSGNYSLQAKLKINVIKNNQDTLDFSSYDFSNIYSMSITTSSENYLSEDDLKLINNTKVSKIDLSKANIYMNTLYDGVFFNNTNLETIILPDSLTVIGKNAFSGCKNLSEVVISEKLTEIQENAFLNCKSIKNIDLYNVKNIGANVFSGCDSLQYIIMSDKIENIDLSFVNGAKNLENIKIIKGNDYFTNDGILYKTEKTIDGLGNDVISYKLVRCPEGKTGNVKMYEKTSVVCENSFYDCAKITSVDLTSDELSRGAEVENYAFYNCINLEKINFSGALKIIGNYAFYNCCNLTSLNLDETSVEEIGEYAFYNCDRIKKITLPSTIREIKNYAFYDLNALKEVVLNENSNALKIGDYVFYKIAHPYKFYIDLSKANNITQIGKLCFGVALPLNGIKNPNMIKVYVKNQIEFVNAFAYNYENLLNIVDFK